MRRLLKRRAVLTAALIAAGCATAPRGRNAEGSDRPPPIEIRPEQHTEPDLVGASHIVRKGETIYRIAKAYGVRPEELYEVNDLSDPRALEPGAEIFIPGARRPLEIPAPGGKPGRGDEDEPALPSTAGGPAVSTAKLAMRWPLKGVLYSRFGIRQGQRHDGLDISAPAGTMIAAAAAGTVIYADKQSGYGSIVIIRHEGEVLTLYAHASVLLVQEGDKITAGQPIAKVGQSGRTTGPHLHFEVREGTRPRNPLFYLP